MMINREQYRKIKEKKLLHKKGKRWVTVSVALLGMLGGGALSSHSSTHASVVPQTSRPVNSGNTVGAQQIQQHNAVPQQSVQHDLQQSTPQQRVAAPVQQNQKPVAQQGAQQRINNNNRAQVRQPQQTVAQRIGRTAPVQNVQQAPHVSVRTQVHPQVQAPSQQNSQSVQKPGVSPQQHVQPQQANHAIPAQQHLNQQAFNQAHPVIHNQQHNQGIAQTGRNLGSSAQKSVMFHQAIPTYTQTRARKYQAPSLDTQHAAINRNNRITNNLQHLQSMLPNNAASNYRGVLDEQQSKQRSENAASSDIPDRQLSYYNDGDGNRSSNHSTLLKINSLASSVTDYKLSSRADSLHNVLADNTWNSASTSASLSSSVDRNLNQVLSQNRWSANGHMLGMVPYSANLNNISGVVSDATSDEQEASSLGNREGTYYAESYANDARDSFSTFNLMVSDYNNVVSGADYWNQRGNSSMASSVASALASSGYLSDEAGYIVIMDSRFASDDSAINQLSVNPNVTDTVSFMYQGKQLGTTTINGQRNKQGVVTTNIPAGFRLAEDGTQYFVFDGGTHSVDILPTQDTDTINYMYQGKKLGSTTMVGTNGDTATANGADMPSGYRLANDSTNTFVFGDGTHNVDIIPITVSTATDTISFVYGGKQEGTATLSGKVDTQDTVTTGVPSGFRLANDGSQYFTFTGGTHTVDVLPVQDTVTIDYLYNGQQLGTTTMTGNNGERISADGSNMPKGYRLSGDSTNSFIMDNKTHDVDIVPITLPKQSTITVNYTDQSGNKFAVNATGTEGQTGQDVTDLAHLPAGYTLNAGQDTHYDFTGGPQTINLMITGIMQHFNITVNVNKYNSNHTLNSNAKQLTTVTGRTGDTYSIDPNKFTPSGYASESVPMTGKINSNGVSNNTASFDYIQTNSAPLTVDYLDQDGKLVSYNTITGFYGQTGSITAAPTGYEISPGQNTGYTITSSPQSMQIQVLGQNASQLADQGKFTIMLHEVADGRQINNIPMVITVSGRVGDTFTVNPANYTPGGFQSVSDPVNGMINPDGISVHNATFTYVSNQSSSILVRYESQSGKVVHSGLVDGIVGNNINITDPTKGGIAVPDGYSLNNGQNVDYSFQKGTQVVTLHVIGDQTENYNFNLQLILRRPDGNGGWTTEGMPSKTITIPESGAIGNTYQVDPNNPQITGQIDNYKGYFIPDSSDNTISGTFGQNGLSNASAAFYYNALPNQPGGTITVNYLDNNRIIDSENIDGAVDQRVNLLNMLPNGYKANNISQYTSVPVTTKPQTINVYMSQGVVVAPTSNSTSYTPSSMSSSASISNGVVITPVSSSINVTPHNSATSNNTSTVTPNTGYGNILVNYVDNKTGNVIKSEDIPGIDGSSFNYQSYNNLVPAGYKFLWNVDPITQFTGGNQTMNIAVTIGSSFTPSISEAPDQNNLTSAEAHDDSIIDSVAAKAANGNASSTSVSNGMSTSTGNVYVNTRNDNVTNKPMTTISYDDNILDPDIYGYGYDTHTNDVDYDGQSIARNYAEIREPRYTRAHGFGDSHHNNSHRTLREPHYRSVYSVEGYHDAYVQERQYGKRYIEHRAKWLRGRVSRQYLRGYRYVSDYYRNGRIRHRRHHVYRYHKHNASRDY